FTSCSTPPSRVRNHGTLRSASSEPPASATSDHTGQTLCPNNSGNVRQTQPMPRCTSLRAPSAPMRPVDCAAFTPSTSAPSAPSTTAIPTPAFIGTSPERRQSCRRTRLPRPHDPAAGLPPLPHGQRSPSHHLLHDKRAVEKRLVPRKRRRFLRVQGPQPFRQRLRPPPRRQHVPIRQPPAGRARLRQQLKNSRRVVLRHVFKNVRQIKLHHWLRSARRLASRTRSVDRREWYVGTVNPIYTHLD